MRIEETRLAGLKLIRPEKYADGRGYFFESFRADVFEAAGIPSRFVQENQSGSVKNVIRGLHYQCDPFTQGKLVRVAAGKIWDIAVDIRPDSATYGSVFGAELSAENLLQLWIPGGFAHGFSVLSEFAVIQYKCDAYYNPAFEGGIRWNDPHLGIDWKIREEERILSEKDRKHPDFGSHRPVF